MEVLRVAGLRMKGGRRGTLTWLMVLNDNYKQLAEKVQHSSADTLLDYCKPQLLWTLIVYRCQLPEPKLAGINVDSSMCPSMLDQTLGIHSVPANNGLQFRHSQLVPMILMPSKTSTDFEEERRSRAPACKTPLSVIHSWSILKPCAFVWVHNNCDVLITSIPKLKFIGS